VRAAAFLDAARAKGADAFLATDRFDVRYLTGFTGKDGWCLLTDEDRILLVGFTELEQAREDAPEWRIVHVRRRFAEALAECAGGVKRLGFDSERLSVAARDGVAERLNRVELVPCPGLPRRVRAVKSPEEVEAIERSAAMADAAFEHILESFKPGVTERELALELEWFIRRGGAEGVAFPVVVASGPRGALPHAVPSDRRIERGDGVVFDLGATCEGYCSDLTRTVFASTITARQEEVYRLVLAAQEAALRVVKPGVRARDVDAAARRVIEDAGYGEFFGHGLGHGVGLDIHELPVLRPDDEGVLQTGEVFTVEPGIYLPGEFGVRIEDLVVLEERGPRLLSGAFKEPVVA